MTLYAPVEALIVDGEDVNRALEDPKVAIALKRVAEARRRSAGSEQGKGERPVAARP